MIVPRPYQSEAVEAVYEHLRTKGNNPCVVLPTGTGKSLVLAQIAKDSVEKWNGRVLILAHVKELLEQNADKIRKLCPELKIGIYSAGLRSRDTTEQVIVAGIQSVYNKACELDAFDLVIVDEAHLISSEGDGMYRTFLADMKVINPHVRVIGLTATPFRLKGGLICKPENILNEICYEAGLKEMIQQGYLSDLEENDLLATYGPDIAEAVGQDNIDACRVNGVLYGLPSNRDIAQGRGCAAIATEYLDGIGYEANTDDEIVKIGLDELNDIYAQLHEKYPDKEVYRPTTGSMSQFSNVDSLGGNVFGVLLDYGQNLDVVNLFESDFYKDYCARLYDYNQKGYISADASTDTTAVGELVKAGTLMSYTTGGKPGIKAQETTLTGRDMTIFQTLDDYISSTSVASMPWTIPISAQHKEAAMKFLNECYTNADIANLLAWGIEGTHYKIGDDGLATYADGVDASNSGWNHSMGWMMPNQFLTHVWEGNDPDLWTEMKEFNTNAKVSKASGFSFDSTNVANELTAVQNVYNEYQTSVEYGFVDPETGIAEMNDKMMTAGLQKIIDEKKAQLAAWQEANK